MANQLDSSSELNSYVREISLRDDDVLRTLREETAELPGGRTMQVMAEEGQLLALLVKLAGARSVLEIGTFTGYSTLCMARAVPPDGLVLTCDISNRWLPIASEHWRRAGVANRIEVRTGAAIDTLAGLITHRGEDIFDFCFIDADKANYRAYYEAALTLVRPGGLIVLDNTLLFGRVIDEDVQDPDTVAIRDLNALLHGDDRVELTVLPMADGITLALRKP